MNDSNPQGAHCTGEGVFYRVWAPGHSVQVVIQPVAGGKIRSLKLTPETAGFSSGADAHGAPGDRYSYQLDNGQPLPCPASRWQPDGVHGPSLVVDPRIFQWTDTDWIRPAFRDLAIYEFHVGTFTEEGTFQAAMSKLPYLRELGINAIEIMPAADFPGERNWGYDGVRLYAPARSYGSPDDLRALVDSAHLHGIAVILDVVFNHFGPDGNYLRQFSSHYFTRDHHTPWGEALKFDGPNSQPVRAYFLDNIRYWMTDFHIDGFRFDATHAIFDESPRSILAELVETIHAHGGYAIAEDERNESRFITPRDNGGYGFDGVWADDFHHSVETMLTKASRYAAKFEGTLPELLQILQSGWLQGHQHEARPGSSEPACNRLLPERFILCISNHDQVGNRPFGDRLHQLTSPEAYRAISLLLLLSPYTPLLFMGQEWSANTPFQYFTDHHDELGQAITKGRREEHRHSAIFADQLARSEVPSPQARKTFTDSKLNWDELKQAPHAGCLGLYREALQLRRRQAAFRPVDRSSTRVALLGGVIALRISENNDGDDWLMLCDLQGGHAVTLGSESITTLASDQRWEPVLSSNEHRFGGQGAAEESANTGHLHFSQPEAVLLRAKA